MAGFWAIANLFDPVLSSQERITNHQKIYYQEGVLTPREFPIDSSPESIRASKLLFLD
ncbi:hypothetical protein H6H01_19575 [Nostoc calcicola FACHB-3891]|nr:hypothetical protein [Nostoc calcicola FACHB-3891]MDZ8058103.1 hypothetical protein [Nostoc sp. EkiNYC01]